MGAFFCWEDVSFMCKPINVDTLFGWDSSEKGSLSPEIRKLLHCVVSVVMPISLVGLLFLSSLILFCFLSISPFYDSTINNFGGNVLGVCALSYMFSQ